MAPAGSSTRSAGAAVTVVPGVVAGAGQGELDLKSGWMCSSGSGEARGDILERRCWKDSVEMWLEALRRLARGGRCAKTEPLETRELDECEWKRLGMGGERGNGDVGREYEFLRERDCGRELGAEKKTSLEAEGYSDG